MPTHFIETNADVETLRAVLADSPKKFDGAVRRLSNRAARRVRKLAIKKIEQEYFVDDSRVQNVVKLMRGVGKRISVVNAKGRPMSLSYFKYSEGVSKIMIQVKRAGQMHSLNKAFIAKFKSGHVGIVERVRKTRFPIEELYSVSIPQMMQNPKVIDYCIEDINKRLPSWIDSEVDKVLK